MKSRYIAVFLGGIILSSLAVADEPIALTRLWNNQHHLYTTNCTAEMQAIRQGYKPESIAGYIARTQAADTVPLYQLFDGSDYLFTTDVTEKDSAKKYGYQIQGIAGYIASHPLPNTVPLYRSVNGTKGDHLFTTSEQEWNNFVHYGYEKEIIAGYVWSAGRKDCQATATTTTSSSRQTAAVSFTAAPTAATSTFGMELPVMQQSKPTRN